MNEVEYSWNDFKSLSINKGIGMQYVEISNDYLIWFYEDYMKYYCVIPKTIPASSEQEDFEDNYKSFANKPVNLGEDIVFSDLEIRDTDEHYSLTIDSRGFIPKTIYIENNLNQDILICVGASRHSDFTTGIEACGGEQTITAGTTDYLTLTDYFPYFKIKARCLTAPTSGSVKVWLLKVRA